MDSTSRSRKQTAPTASAWRVLSEVIGLTLTGSLLLRVILTVDAGPIWLAPAIWVYLPLLPLLIQQLPLAPHGYGVPAWRRASGRSLLMALGILAGFAIVIIGWRQLAGDAPTVEQGVFSFDTVLGQLLLVAVPEELFFRGYVQERLRFWAAQHGFPQHPVAILLGAGLFAVAHVIVTAGWRRAMIFFPGCVMGWLRVYSRGVVVPTLFHWLSNLLVLALSL